MLPSGSSLIFYAWATGPDETELPFFEQDNTTFNLTVSSVINASNANITYLSPNSLKFSLGFSIPAYSLLTLEISNLTKHATEGTNYTYGYGFISP